MTKKSSFLSYSIENKGLFLLFILLLSKLQLNDILRQKDAILFLSELISCSKNVAENRITFNELLFENDILPILNNLIENNSKNKENNKIKETININTVEIFISILSTVPFLVMKYLRENEGHMLQNLSNLLLKHTNFGVKYEVSQIFKKLIETEGDKYDKKIFFNSTIEKFMNFLISPNLDNQNEKSSTIQIIIEIEVIIIRKFIYL